MKKRILFCCLALVIVVLIGIGCIHIFYRGTYLWGMVTPHDTVCIDAVDTVDTYNDYYEQKNDPRGSYDSLGYTESYLFGDGCHFIVYGEVLKCNNYVFYEDSIAYSCHTVTIYVERDIWGGLKKGQEITLFCRWHYDVYEDDLNNIQEGREGIFIVNGDPVKLHSNQTGENILALGSLRQTKRFHYCLTTYIDGLEELETKKEVIKFWKKEGWIAEEGE